MATDLGKIAQTLEGEYDSSKIYNKLDTVTSNGSSYVSKINNNNQPLSNNLAWQLSAQKGIDGEDGKDGENGTNAQSFNFKGNVENYPSLPNSGNTINDAYYNEEDGLTYIYNGNSFPAQGKGVDFKGSNKMPIWSAKSWAPNSQVIKDDILYNAPEGADPSDIPGESDKWVSLEGTNPALIGVNKIPVGTELISELIGSSLDNTDLWNDGYINAAGGISGIGGTWRHTKNFYPIEGINHFKLAIYGNSCIAFYDANKNLLLAYKTPNTSATTYYNADYTPPANTKYFKFSHYTGLSTSNISVKTLSVTYSVTDNVFVLSNEVDEKIENKVKNITGADIIPVGTNIIAELTGSELTNAELWGDGFLNSLGNVQAGSGWHYTKKYYKLRKGTYSPFLIFSGNAKAIIYSAPGVIKEVITNASGTYTSSITFTEDVWLRFSHSGTSTATIAFINTTPLNPIFVTSENIAAYAPATGNKAIRETYLNSFKARRKRPIVTIISDDGQPHNLQWFIPLLDEFRVKATFAMIGSRILAADNGTGTVSITSDQTRSLYQAGHDIASHTWSHTANWSTALTLDQIDDEMSRNKVFLEKITNSPVNMFISPFGLRSSAIDNILSRYYDTNFITDVNKSVALPVDNYFIYRTSFDADDANPSLLWDSTLKPAIDDALANNKWLIFAIHPQYTQYNSWANKEARKNELRTLLQYCKDNNIEVTTANRAYDYFKNHVDIGVKRVDLKYYKLGMDMTEENVNYFEI